MPTSDVSMSIWRGEGARPCAVNLQLCAGEEEGTVGLHREGFNAFLRVFASVTLLNVCANQMPRIRF